MKTVEIERASIGDEATLLHVEHWNGISRMHCYLVWLLRDRKGNPYCISEYRRGHIKDLRKWMLLKGKTLKCKAPKLTASTSPSSLCAEQVDAFSPSESVPPDVGASGSTEEETKTQLSS